MDSETVRCVPRISTVLTEAPPFTLHGEGLDRVDCNSPVLRRPGGIVAFVSDYRPIGHSYRRSGASLALLGLRNPVRLIDDPQPDVGKWIEAVWPDPGGTLLYGWYHAETLAPCDRRMFVPSIGAMVSADDGRSWHLLGPLLDAPAGGLDCEFDNGMIAGGYGDFSVLTDRRGQWFYLHFSSYLSAEAEQGIAVARYPVAARARPAGALELWTRDGWRAAGTARPAPIVPVARGWRHPDPDAHWGPAVHFNRDLGLYVMLLNHCQKAHRNWNSTGVDVCYSADIADPNGWTAPRRVVDGELWYPQVIGLGADDSDRLAGARARFCIAGYSAWEIEFRPGAVQGAVPSITGATIARLFGRNPTRSGMPPAAV